MKKLWYAIMLVSSFIVPQLLCQENVLETYENEVKRSMNEYNTKTTRQKYASIDVYVGFKQGIYVC